MKTLSDLHNLAFSPTTVSNSGEDVILDGEPVLLETLAADLSILEVSDFTLKARVVRWKKQGLKISGSINAKLSQECVSTLDPVEETIALEFERRFMQAHELVRQYERIEDGDLVIDPDENDEPDEMPAGGIDLWETVLEEINLALNPFPRSSDMNEETASENTSDDENDDEDTTYRPFADLNALINEKNSKN